LSPNLLNGSLEEMDGHKI